MSKPKTVTRQRRLPRDARVSAIMEVARPVLRERGSEQFLVAEVAERCGVSEGTIYKYFPTKRDLLVRVAEQWFDDFLAEARSANRNRPIAERLYHVIWEALAIIRREPSLTRFVLMELRPDPNYRSMRIYEQNRQIVGWVTEVLEDGIRSGEFQPDLPVKVMRDMVFGAIEHQTWAYLRGEGRFSVEETAESITRLALRGILSAPPVGKAELTEAIVRLEKIAGGLRKCRDGDPAAVPAGTGG